MSECLGKMYRNIHFSGFSKATCNNEVTPWNGACCAVFGGANRVVRALTIKHHGLSRTQAKEQETSKVKVSTNGKLVACTGKVQ